MTEFDYIIVGAGSAGCVLAHRLSEDPDCSVLLLEAGADDRSLFIRMPTALSIPMNTPRFNWGYWGQPEPHLDGRRMDCARGKVLGGSSAINGMVYVRGHASDFDQWEAAGASWSLLETCAALVVACDHGDACRTGRHINTPLQSSAETTGSEQPFCWRQQWVESTV